MTDTLTQKQEDFCLAYIETGNASEAYRRAYDAENMKPETICKRASELLANGDITGRVKALRKATAERVAVDRAWVLERLIDNHNRAMQESEGSVANRALELIGKEIGMFVERKEVGKPGDFSDLSDDELDRALKREAEKLGIEVSPLDERKVSQTQH